MPSFEEARGIILGQTKVLGEEKVALLEAHGRVLSQDVHTPWDIPLCDYSAMDGFAVRAADCTPLPATLRVTGYIPAGAVPTTAVEPGCAIRIMTGAPTPPGCDAIVPIEETTQEGERVTLKAPVRAKQHIRFQGQDLRAGGVALHAGTIIAPPQVSLLASIGKALVPVYKRARVAILSTGDELIELGKTPGPGRIINSNALSLAAAVRECGAIPVILGIAADERESLREKMLEGVRCDALITSAGVSAGDRDLVREILSELGATEGFWKVAIKPGGPTAFASINGLPVFSLPGNPVSTMVTFELFVKPALRKMMGEKKVVRTFVKGVLAEEIRKAPGKLNFVRVRVEREDGTYRAYSSGSQHTAALPTMVSADALAVLPLEASLVPAGSAVELLMLRDVDLTEG
ncbi:molybdopterin molybdotransferase MoeA [Geomonas sp. RF6]|uniref:molybdopterin molybdotransferase MoeA n=1 Tax=Geomonas sp. RF6 TaxID=2897342 RepID=UPI001E45A162|nr:gephyrin-like molybdotransferase Glp [Geomonas sp. RF6]UFS69198.1 molybdopterin molybdotransferase MoeA [Geomonas sp. RF6]